MVEATGNPVGHLTEYELHHLPAHLARSDRAADLHRLLWLAWQKSGTRQSPQAQPQQGEENAWYAAKAGGGDTAGYLDDVERAWQLVDGEDTLDRQGVSLQVGYALIVTSLNSLVGRIPPLLLAASVDKGVLSPAQGLAYAQRVPDPTLRAQALLNLRPHLAGPLQEEALQGTLAALPLLDNHLERTRLLKRLAPHLPEWLLREAAAAAQADEDESRRADTLKQLAPYLPESIVWQIVRPWQQDRESAPAEEAGLSLKGLLKKVLEPSLWEEKPPAAGPETGVMAALAARLATLGRPAEALGTAALIDAKYDRAKAMAGIAPHLPESSLAEAETLIRGLPGDENVMRGLKGKAMTALARRLAQLDRVEKATTLVTAVPELGDRVEAMALLAPYLPPRARQAIQKEALAAARSIKRKDDRAQALAKLAPALPDKKQAVVVLEALALVRPQAYEFERVLSRLEAIDQGGKWRQSWRLMAALLRQPSQIHGFTNLAGYRLRQGVRSSLAVVWAVFNRNARLQLFLRLLPRVPDVLRESLVQRALALARMLRKERAPRDQAFYWSTVLQQLLPYLSRPQLRRLVTAESVIGDGRARQTALSLLAQPPTGEADESTRELYAQERAPLPAQTEPPADDGRTAWTAVRETTDEEELADLVSSLVKKHPDPATVSAGLWAAQKVTHSGLRAKILVRLAPHLLEPELREALRLAQALPEYRRVDDSRLMSESMVALSLPPEERDTRPKGMALAGLLPRLAELDRAREALAEALALEDDFWRGKALARMAPSLPADLLPQAVRAAEQIPLTAFDESRTEALTKLAIALVARDNLPVALAVARTIDGVEMRVEALRQAASRVPRLDMAQGRQLWQETLHALATRHRADLLRDLVALVPFVVTLGGREALAEIGRYLEKVGRWWP